MLRGANTGDDILALRIDQKLAVELVGPGRWGAGERDTARREFVQALVLLEREDASRLLLFGGGFSREALMALCHSALRECGEMA